MARIERIVGIDIGKETVEACIGSLGLRLKAANTPAGHRELVAWLGGHEVGKAVMEASGGYERDWAGSLRRAGIEVRIVDPKRVRHFAKAAGRLAKNDPIDAEMICRFAETFPEALGQRHDPVREELGQLVNARAGLKDIQTRLTNWSEHRQPAAARRAQAAIDRVVSAELKKLEAAIATKLRSVGELAEAAEIIESVPGLGTATAACMLAKMPELGKVSGKAIAALLGGAPYDDDSGKRRGERHIKGGRRSVRNQFFMPVLGAATQHNPVMKAFYRRLMAKGKAHKVAVIACMRKLITILNTMIARREKWDPAKHVDGGPQGVDGRRIAATA